MSIAADRWHEIDGEAAMSGVDLEQLSLRRFLNAVHYWCLQRVEDAEEFLFRLEEPVPGRVRDADVRREIDDFASFMAVMGGG
jgi:hypothetical protein